MTDSVSQGLAALPKKQGQAVIWIVDGLLDKDVQKSNLNRALRAVLFYDRKLRRKGRAPLFLLFNTSPYLRLLATTAFPKRVFDLDKMLPKAISTSTPEDVLAAIADVATHVVAFGKLNSEILSALDGKPAIVYSHEPTLSQEPNDGSFALRHNDMPYGAYRGYLAKIHPTRISPTKGVRLHVEVDVRPKYNI